MKENTLAGAAYRAIKESILTGKYAPDQVLHEPELAAALGMSRQPVHQALAQLYEEGLLSSVARRGIRVQGIDAEKLDELYTIRKVLERGALREIFEAGEAKRIALQLEEQLLEMEAARGDREVFHRRHYEFYLRLVAALGSPSLEKTYVRSGMEQILRLNLLVRNDADRSDAVLAETRALVDCLRHNDLDAADALYCRLWSQARERARRALAQYLVGRS